MLSIKDLRPATEDDLEEMGYYANGWLVDMDKPAWRGDVNVNGEDLIIIVAYNDHDEHWFCEDDTGGLDGTVIGTTPEEVLAEWEKGKR